MINSIASQVSALASQGQRAASTEVRSAKASTEASTQVSAQNQADTEQSAAVSVELSAQAQAKELKTEGMSVSEIATKLKLDEKTVDTYLGVQA